MEDMTLMGLMMGGGMIANAGSSIVASIQGGLTAQFISQQQRLASDRMARADENIATTQANAWQNIAKTQADAGVEQTRWQVMGMIFAANSQYLQAMQQMQYADMADRRQSTNFRLQLANEIRTMTLLYNAQLHAVDLSHQEKMTEMQLGHEEKMYELEHPQLDGANLDRFLI